MALPGTSTIADTALRARRSVVAHFGETGAVSPDGAVTYQPQRHPERRALAYLLSRGIVHLTQDGRYWLDQAAVERWRRESRTRTALIIGGAAATVLGAIAYRRYRQTRS